MPSDPQYAHFKRVWQSIPRDSYEVDQSAGQQNNTVFAAVLDIIQPGNPVKDYATAEFYVNGLIAIRALLVERVEGQPRVFRYRKAEAFPPEDARTYEEKENAELARIHRQQVAQLNQEIQAAEAANWEKTRIEREIRDAEIAEVLQRYGLTNLAQRVAAIEETLRVLEEHGAERLAAALDEGAIH